MAERPGDLQRIARADPIRNRSELAPTAEERRRIKEEVLVGRPLPEARRAGPWWRGRRTLWAVGVALLIAGGAIAAVTLAPSEDVRIAVRSLQLPAPDRERLQAVPNSTRLVVRLPTTRGTSGLWRFRTRGRGSFVVVSNQDRAGNPTDSGAIGRCPPIPRGRQILLCLGGSSRQVRLEAAGRVTPKARTVEVRYPRGRKVTGRARRGYFLVVSYSAPRATPRVVVARDQRGRVVARTRWFGR